ncbi:MAG: amidohydrolase [Dehalococcoidia bacterium]|nr:MAG: amidohydrolase [Dehalococcoidia bacterium]
MIIDIHTHLCDYDGVAKPFWDGWAEVSALRVNRPLEKIQRRLPEFWDISGDMIVKDMDDAGIDKSVLLAIDWGLARHLGDLKLSIEEISKVYADAVEKHPQRLIAFAGIDPRRNKAAELVGRFLREWGMKGIKFHTAAGFYPNDKACYPIYEKALEYGVPVLLHTGEVLKPLHFKYCQPIYAQEVAMDFPDLPIILAHTGGCWYSEAVAICNSATNVYLDVSVWQSRLFRPLEFYRALRTLLDSVSWQRVLFGSDYPFLKLLVNQERWVKAFTEIPDSVKEQGIEFKDEEIEGIMGGNAAKILGLTE